MANIPEGYGIIAGRGRENAQKALAAAEAAGVDALLVRTVAEGYLVPDAVLKEFHKAAKAEAEPKKAPAKKAPAKPAPEPAQESGSEAETDKE